VVPEKRKWTRSPARLARYDSEREAIMRAAYRLIGREGGSVSVQEILDAAGLSTRAFYRHFASKDELVLSMYRTDNQRVADALWAATEEEPDAWRALQAWVDLSLSVVFDKGRERHSRVLGSPEAKSAAGWSQEFLDGVGREMASLEAVLARGARDGTFPTVQVETDAQVIFGATNNFASLHMAGGPDVVSREQALDAVLGAARRMLGVDYGATAGSGSTSRARAKREASP
jgi:AcrR family transcriptional regulator